MGFVDENFEIVIDHNIKADLAKTEQGLLNKEFRTPDDPANVSKSRAFDFFGKILHEGDYVIGPVCYTNLKKNTARMMYGKILYIYTGHWRHDDTLMTICEVQFFYNGKYLLDGTNDAGILKRLGEDLVKIEIENNKENKIDL